MDYGYLTLVAPILTLAVAIATRKVPLAMLVGIFTGQLIICGWNPFAAINESVNGILSVCADTGNLKTFLFTALMGAFVILVRISGGVKGFVNYLTEQSKRVKSPRMAMLIAYVIGIIIFIDGLLSIMFTGVVTRPLIDKFKVSREKLAYICDATSAPINAIIPLNSWGAMLMGLIYVMIVTRLNPQQLCSKFFDGMGKGYGSILGIIIAAGVFASGLRATGVIDLFVSENLGGEE